MATKVTLGGIDLTAKDAFGVEWHVEDVEGWDSPEVRQETMEMVGDHGVMIGKSFYGQRALVVSGKFYAPGGESAMWDARERLAKAVDVTGSGSLLVVYENPTKQVTVYRSGRLQMKTLTTSAVEFQVNLIAPDPRKYSTVLSSQTVTGSGTVTTGGDFNTYPTLEVSGATNPVITQNSYLYPFSIKYNGVIGSGASALTIDTQKRTVVTTGSGADQYSNIDFATRWWGLLSGANNISISSGSVIVRWRDAWI